MTDMDVIDLIRRQHLRANIARWEESKGSVVHWDRAWIDPGGTIFGPGPYLKVPVTPAKHLGWGDFEPIHRVYPTARARRRINASPWKYTKPKRLRVTPRRARQSA